MPIVKVTDLAYARLQSPSLDDAERFLTDFGMVRAERTRDALYMRGTDAPHHVHVTHVGPSKFIGLAFAVASDDELRLFAKAPGASAVEHLDEPGGGLRVRITDPNGYQIEVVYGLQALAPGVFANTYRSSSLGTENARPMNFDGPRCVTWM